MGQIIAGAIGVVIAIGTAVYEIGKAIYTYLIIPLTKIKEALQVVNGIIKGVIEAIKGKIDYVLKLIGVDVLVDVVRGISYFKGRIEEIAKGHVIDLVEVLGDIYQTIAETAKEIIHFTSSILEPVFDRLAILKKDIKNITDFKMKEVTNAVDKLANEVKTMPKRLLDEINAEIKKESQRLKDGFAGKLAIVDARLTDIISLSKDLSHFAEMFTKMMEV